MSSSPLPRRSGWWQNRQSFCDIGGGTIGPCPRQVFIVDAQQSELPLAEDDDDLKSFRLYCVRVHACTTHTSKLSVTGTRLPPADHTATARVSCTTRTRHSSHTHITSAHTTTHVSLRTHYCLTIKTPQHPTVCPPRSTLAIVPSGSGSVCAGVVGGCSASQGRKATWGGTMVIAVRGGLVHGLIERRHGR